MSRLANKKKAGYYPTPDSVIKRIRSHLALLPASHEFRALDPCAGEGRALRALFGFAHGSPKLYGIELDYERAAAAERYLDRVLQGSYEAMRLPKAEPGISLLFLNPPYDQDDGAGGRLELTFLRDTQDWLMPAGLLIYIIPQYRISGYVARRLATHFRDIRIYRFPDPEFERFRQVVIFGVKREQPVKDDQLALEIAQAKTGTLPSLPYVDHPRSDLTYRIPAKPETRFYFHTTESSPEDVAKEALEHGVWNTSTWADHFVCPSASQQSQSDCQAVRSTAHIQPLMPLRRGHIAMVLAAGLLDNMQIENAEQTLLVKGRLRKVEENVSTEADREAGQIRTRERFQASIHWMDVETGQIGFISGDALRGWMLRWQDQLAAKIVEAFQPLHQMTYDGVEDVVEITRHHSKRRKLPGRAATGLFEAQRHAVAALTRHFDAGRSYAFLQATMGTGKTTIATSLADVLKKRHKPDEPFPVIVVCPPHLIEKWPREIAQIVPMAHGHPIRRVSDFEDYVHKLRTLDPRTLQIAVVPTTMLKLGSGWTPALVEKTSRYWHSVKHQVETTSGTVEWTLSGWARTFHCPRCGGMVTQRVAGAPIPVVDRSYFEGKRLKCEYCAEPLYQEWRGQWPQPERDMFGRLKPLPEPRYPIARYIAHKYPGFFELAIVDEVHEMKAQSSDRGHAFGVLAGAAKRTLGMTGTLFGGMATSLFYLLHRLDHRVRQDFAWSDGQRFAALYGVLEKVRDEEEPRRPEDEQYGTYTGLRRTRAHAKERPGISPALVTRLLDTTIFLGLQDLGFDLPDYQETPVTFTMPNGDTECSSAVPEELLGARRAHDMAGTYARLERGLRQLAMDDWSRMGEYLQTTLCWVNAPWRDEETSIGTFRALPADILYPKERWLIEKVKAERRRGRRVVVYLRQTGTRDIQPRLATLLTDAGLKSIILNSSTSTVSRERWIRGRIKEGLDVLLCNPILVQTGLDLVDFQTFIFYEPMYSVYPIQQASRRGWRLGQVDDVEVYFLAYEGTMEHRAIAHVGAKVAAAQLLYGDDVEGALVQESGAGGSLLEELARQVADNADVPDLGEMFVTAHRQAEGQSGWLLGEQVDLSDRTPFDPTPEPSAAISLDQIKQLTLL